MVEQDVELTDCLKLLVEELGYNSGDRSRRRTFRASSGG